MGIAVFLVMKSPHVYGQDARQAAFERVFGEKARFPPSMIQRIRGGPPGAFQFEWEMTGAEQMPDLEFEAFHRLYVERLNEALQATEKFIAAVKTVLDIQVKRTAAVERFYEEELGDWMAEAGLGKRIRQSPAGKRYYRGLIRDELFWALAREFHHREEWDKVERLHSDGAYAEAAKMLKRLDE